VSREFPRIAAVRALGLRGGGADYHDQAGGHWVDGEIATPMFVYAEFLMMAPDAAVVPMFTPLLTGEPVPENGRIRSSALDRPGFGVELDRSLPLERPFARSG
jgi:hypothetical protein